MAQSLGGMEVIVGVSSLAGGLVLDKKRTGPGKRTPHQIPLRHHFLCLLPAMFIMLGEVSTPSAGMIVVITLAADINSHESYPVLCTLVERVEGVSRDADELDKWYNSDSLFGFAITTHSDRIVQMGRLEWDVVLNHILLMGIYNWKDTDKQGGGSCLVMSIRYAAVLGNRLLQRIERGDDKVGLLPKNQGS